MNGARRCVDAVSPALISGCVLLAVMVMNVVTPAQQDTSQIPPVFRAVSTAVTVDVSVKRGNRPVAGLVPSDFEVTDKGVRQIVDHALHAAVPIDVTLIIDASGSTASIFEDIRRDSQRFLGLLRPDDRVRVLVIETTPYELVPLQMAGQGFVLPQEKEPGNLSSIYDTLHAALVVRPDPDRRRLVLAITDGTDTKSITSVQTLEHVARRTGTVLHVIMAHPKRGTAAGSAPARRLSSPSFQPDAPSRAERELFEALPALTGGAFHGVSLLKAQGMPVDERMDMDLDVDVVKAVRGALEEFRQSYVIQYQPRAVAAAGWHDVVVRVKGVDRKGVRARAGYVGAAH